MYGSVGKYEKQKSAGKDQGPFFRTLRQDLGVVDVVKETHNHLPLLAPSVHLWFLTICMLSMCVYIHTYIYTHSTVPKF